MVSMRSVLLGALLFGGTEFCAAQGRFSGGRGGGDATLALSVGNPTSHLYTYPNPARVGEPVYIQGATTEVTIFSILCGKQNTNNILIFDKPGIYILKLNTQWLKQVVY